MDLQKILLMFAEAIKELAKFAGKQAKYRGFIVNGITVDFANIDNLEGVAKGDKMPPKLFFKDGTFRTHYRKLEYRFMLNGKQISVCGETREECYAKRLEIITGKRQVRNVLTFGQWLTRWAEKYKKPNVTAGSYEAIERYIKRISEKLGNIPLNRLTTEQLQDFLNSEDRDNTRTKLASVLSDSLKKAQATQLIKYNPFLAVEYSKCKSVSYPVLQPDDQVKVYKFIVEKKYKDLYKVAMCTGMRISEIIGLRVADINFTEGIITVKQQLDRENNPKEKLKTESSYRQIDFLPELFEGIDLSGEYVFQGMSYTATRSYFRRLFEKLKLEFVLHSFRHTFISNCYYVGIRDKQIQLWAGHSKVEITINTYTHIIKGDSPFIDYVRKLKQRLELENRP